MSNVVKFQPHADRLETLLAKMRTQLDYLKIQYPEKLSLKELEEFISEPQIMQMIRIASQKKIKHIFGEYHETTN